ncbi:MAG: hypothetical protein K2X48_01975 [Chitinophagaceae bacterium]|nr:hypothetical protein [Chitinophagaceae bacterium]
MKYLLSLLFPGWLSCCVHAQTPVIHFTNGYWFNGNGFDTTVFYSVNGLLTKTKPASVDTVIDLHHQYLIPPFGEAHNHSPDTEPDFAVFRERYLSDGIYYIKNPNSIPFTTQKIQNQINNPTSLDIVFANGGLTSAGGHPSGLYSYLLTTIYKKSITGWTNKSMEGHAYYVISNKDDIDKKWPFITADKPSFIKLYLLYSEEFERRDKDSVYNGKKGLNPKLLKAIIQKAHASGLTVSCHAETPADVLNAVKAGANEINHLPGYQVRWKEGYTADYYLLPETTVKLMKKADVHADATYSLAETEIIETDSVQYRLRKEVQQKNLLLLKKYKVPVTIACDSYNLTSKTEADYLYRLGIYSNLELLRMWCETTPLAIFPKRKIAFLKEGYEASFLVLKENPLLHFDSVFNIQLRIKQGNLLW